MPKLRCVSKYANRGTVYSEGETFNADEDEAAFLMRDAPGAFEEVKAPSAPSANKAVLEPEEKKAPREDDLTAISGISNTRQRQLRFAGIYTFADVADESNLGVLMQLHGVGEQTAHEWQEAARERM